MNIKINNIKLDIMKKLILKTPIPDMTEDGYNNTVAKAKEIFGNNPTHNQIKAVAFYGEESEELKKDFK